MRVRIPHDPYFFLLTCCCLLFLLFFFVLELLNAVFLVFLFIFCLFVLFSIILFKLFHFLTITTHVVLELICRVSFFITFSQCDDNGFDHLIPSNVRCPVDLLHLLNVVDAVTPMFRCDTGKSFLDHLFDSCQVERQVSTTNVACNVRMERQSYKKIHMKIAVRTL